MPLNPNKGKKAFKENVAIEIAAGKPPKQAAAIAYSEARKSKAKKPRGKQKK